MSRNAIAAMAVIFVSGFAGCAATARADETAAVEAPIVAPTRPAPATPVLSAAVAATLIASVLYVSAATRRALRNASPG